MLTLRYTTGSPPRCGAPSFPHKVLRPCGGPICPARKVYDLPERGLNGAYKVSATHFYRPRAGAQKGEPPPLSPPQRRGTRGRINKYFKVDSLRLLQALTYPECRTAALHLPAHPSPFPAIGKGGGGKGQIRPWLPWERFCAQYGLIFDCRQKSIRIQHSQRQGSWGSAPSVFC